jgi:hypothetical protein
VTNQQHNYITTFHAIDIRCECEMVIQGEETKRIYLKAHDKKAKMVIYDANSMYQLGCHIGYL